MAREREVILGNGQDGRGRLDSGVTKIGDHHRSAIGSRSAGAPKQGGVCVKRLAAGQGNGAAIAIDLRRYQQGAAKRTILLNLQQRIGR